MTDVAPTPADLELLALTDPLAALAQAQAGCIVPAEDAPPWRETYLSILRPWWESASVEEMARWLSRWAAYSPEGTGEARLRTVIRLGCLAAKRMNLGEDAEAAGEMERIEAWAFGSAAAKNFEPSPRDDDWKDDSWKLEAAYLRAIDRLSEAVWHRKWRGDVEDFFNEAYHASNGEDFAPLIRAAIPLETLVP